MIVSETVGQLTAFVVTVLAALASHFFITMSLMILVAKVKPWLHYRAMATCVNGRILISQ